MNFYSILCRKSYYYCRSGQVRIAGCPKNWYKLPKTRIEWSVTLIDYGEVIFFGYENPYIFLGPISSSITVRPTLWGMNYGSWTILDNRNLD